MSAYPVALIDLAALKHNLTCLQQHASQSKVMAVIKANAYGHGAVKVAQALQAADAFAVARLAEGLLLRQQGIDKPIVLLEGVNSADEFITAAANDLSPVIHAQNQIDCLINLSIPKPLKFIWLMVNSGMNRLGIRPNNSRVSFQSLSSSILPFLSCEKRALVLCFVIFYKHFTLVLSVFQVG